MQAAKGKLCLLVSLLLLTLLPSAHAKGDLFMAADNPSVDTYRAMVYAQTDDRIRRLNEQFGEFYTSAHNKFSHLTLQEFAKTYLGGAMSPPGSVQRNHVGQPGLKNQKKNQLSSEKDLEFKASYLNSVVDESGQASKDWSTSNPPLTTNVKDQGGCGSCWAFAGIAEIESYFLKKHKLWLDLSEQQMVDCVPAVQSGNKGCGGGYVDSVSFYSTQYPIAQEKYYLYTAEQGSCQNSKIAAGETFKINSYVYIYDCLALTTLILNHRPVATSGKIDQQWQNYDKGVVLNCNQGQVSGHAFLVVAVKLDGTDANKDNPEHNYWTIKNSWGTDWGEGGYMRMFRDRTDTTKGPCGFCGNAMYSL